MNERKVLVVPPDPRDFFGGRVFPDEPVFIATLRDTIGATDMNDRTCLYCEVFLVKGGDALACPTCANARRGR